jgi:Flp pilus assembly protein CpaB
VIAADGMYQSATIDEDKVEDGAISDPDAIKEQFASKSIYPGEQLRPQDFQANAEGLSSSLLEYERAIAVPVDNYHGLVGELEDGDRVDVLGFYELETASQRFGNFASGHHAVIKTVLQDVLVLKAPEERLDGNTDMQEVYLKMPDDRAAELVTHVADAGKVWLAMRPAAGGESHKPGIATVTRVLFGTKAQAFGLTKKQATKALMGR